MIFLAADRQGPRGSRQEFLGYFREILGTVELLDQQCEFVSPHARQCIRRTQAFEQVFRHLTKYIVTCTVSERVVDDLEAIKVEKQHAHPAPGSLRAPERSGQVIIEEQSVGQSGQIIMMSEVPNSIGGPAGLDRDAGEVRTNADQVGTQPARDFPPTDVDREGAQRLTLAPEDGPRADRAQTGPMHEISL